jgi:hypothetical protein
MKNQTAVLLLRVALAIWLGLELFVTVTVDPSFGSFAAPLISVVAGCFAFWFAAPKIYRQPEEEHGFWSRLSIISAAAAAVALCSVPVIVHHVRASPAQLELEQTGCGNQLLQAIPSTNSRRSALVFERDCGATAGFSTQISIVPAGEPLPAGAGNAFTADTDHSAAPSGPGGGPDLEVTWQSSTCLLIRYHPKARVSVEPQVEGVTIRTSGTLPAAERSSRVPQAGAPGVRRR